MDEEKKTPLNTENEKNYNKELESSANEEKKNIEEISKIEVFTAKIKNNKPIIMLSIICVVFIICFIILAVNRSNLKSGYDTLKADYGSLQSRYSDLSSEYDKIDHMKKYKDIPKELLDETLTKYQEQLEKKEAEEKKKAEEEAKRQKEEEEAKRKREQEKEAKQYETGITYDQLARDPDKYTGNKVKFSGKVIQVMEDGSGEVQLRVAVNDNYDTVLYCMYPDSIVSSRILKDDQITIYGMSLGTITYKSTMGGNITIPAVDVEKIKS